MYYIDYNAGRQEIANNRREHKRYRRYNKKIEYTFTWNQRRKREKEWSRDNI